MIMLATKKGIHIIKAPPIQKKQGTAICLYPANLLFYINALYNPTNDSTVITALIMRSRFVGFIGGVLGGFFLRRFFVLHTLRVCAIPSFFGLVVPHFMTASDAVFFPCHN
jgi:hypothetical protein